MYSENERLVFFSPSLQQFDTAFATAPDIRFVMSSQSMDEFQECGSHGTERGDQLLVFQSGNQSMQLSVEHDYDRIGTGAQLNYNAIPESSSGSMVINGHTYNDVRVIQLDSSQCVNQYVWRYYINQEFGILQFEKKNGPTWKLQR
jgi:hypothetical protein